MEPSTRQRARPSLRQSRGWRILFLGLYCSLFSGSPHDAWGTTVLQTTVPEMIAKAELVFEGNVVAVEARADSTGRSIHTHVVFEIVDLIKGSWPEPTIELRFLGGTVGDRTVSVVAMQFPELGEHGIYFVESPGRFQVNPLLGWAQGHLLILRDTAGTSRVWTQDRKPIVSIEANPSKQAGAISRGTAAGIVADAAAPDDAAITASELKRSLRSLLKNVR